MVTRETQKQLVNSYPLYKSELRRLMFKVGNIRRVHIIGAARSGTTMLHYAMAAFQDTILFDKEVDVTWEPSLRTSAQLLYQTITLKKKPVFITKRSYGWYRSDAIKRLTYFVIRENIGLIHIVRDPRDSLTSVHRGKKGYYLEPERWMYSIDAAEHLFDQLKDYPAKIVVRYEDVVTSPEQAKERIEQVFDLKLREEVKSWAALADNLRLANSQANMADAMHSIRDFDPNSIGQGHKDLQRHAHFQSLLQNRSISKRIYQFMDEYGYEI